MYINKLINLNTPLILFLKTIYKSLKSIIFKFKYQTAQHNYHKKAIELQKKEKIRVAFFVVQESVWKCDDVFKLMTVDSKFEPIIIIIPYIMQGEKIMLETMQRAVIFFKNKNYPTISCYDHITNKWLNIKNEIKPDIVFFTNPHNLTYKEYYINNWLDCLTCYIPYSYMIANLQNSQFNQDFHNLIWRCYYETPIHLQMAKKYARNHGKNVKILGYAGNDIFNSVIKRSPWKKQEVSKLKIIWAPHHTIEEQSSCNYSNFFELSDYMLELAKQFQNSIQIAFKPHPMLKGKLYKLPNWGIKKTDNYYKKWENLSNGQLEDGDYVDLFKTSDAMILDSISFMAEYLLQNKPILFCNKNDSIINKFNEFGIEVYNTIQQAHTKRDINNFIYNTLHNIDPYKSKREIFIKNYLLCNQYASQNIISDLKKLLVNEKTS